MVDLVVVTQPKTLPLFKIFLESLYFYYKGDWRLYVFADDECIERFKAIDLGAQVKVIRNEDVLPNHLTYKGYIVQQYFKLIAHELVSQPYYLVLDDDFIFIKETFDHHFFVQEKPFWFFQDWKKSGDAVRWREPTSQFLKRDVPYCFMAGSHFMFKTEVVKSFLSSYPLQSILKQETFSEFSCYGAYTWENFRDHYHWINNYWGDEAISCRINQVPPDYLKLDPTSKVQQYSQFHHLMFWSHWNLCEKKMREFFEASK